MKKRNAHTKKGNGKKKIFLCFFLEPLLFLALTLIFAIISYGSDDPSAKSELYSAISLLTTAGAGAFILTKLCGEGGGYTALFSSLFSSLLIFVISLITAGKVTLAALMNILCFMLVSLLFIFLGRKRPKNKHSHIRG